MKCNHCDWAKNDWIWYPMTTTTWARHNIPKVTASMTISPCKNIGCTMDAELNNKQYGSCPKR